MKQLHLPWMLHHIIIYLILPSESIGKYASKSEAIPVHPPKHQIHQSNQIPSDLQVTVFLHKGATKSYNYWSILNNGPLSATLTPCSSTIHWSFYYGFSNSTDKNNEFSTINSMTTNYLTSSIGWYTLELTAKEKDTVVHIYISTEQGGPQALQNAQNQQLRMLKRNGKNRVTVRWEPSLVDPQGTKYCLVISGKSNHKSLCEAQEKKCATYARFQNKPMAASQTMINWQPGNKIISQEEKSRNCTDAEPKIVCVGKRTHYTITNMKHNQLYYLDVFAQNQQTNLSYPYTSKLFKFDKRTKPINLKSDKAMYANLKKLDGKAFFRYKIGRRLSSKKLNIFIMTCGGSVDVEITINHEKVAPRKRIEGFGQIAIANPVQGSRYYIKVFSNNVEDYNHGIEIYATTKLTSPIPSMPAEPIVQEYISLRKCDSVTVGWLPAPGQKISYYCLVIKEGKIHESDNHSLPNQCGIEKRLKKSVDFALKYCKYFQHNESQVITERISQLKPGNSYIVQVITKKPKGKTLSYDLLEVHTTPSCH